MKLRKHRVVPLILVALIAGLVPLATPALAAPATVVANLDPVPDGSVAPGAVSTFSLSITPDSRTLARYTLSPAAGYKIASVVASTGTATLQASGNILVTGLSVSPSQTATLTFTANASCVSGPQAWGLDSRDSQGRLYSNGTSDLSTEVTGACDLDIVAEPRDTKVGELITDNDRNDGNPIQVRLEDDNGALVTHFATNVTFVFGSKAGNPGAILSVAAEPLVGGVATFDDLLEIDTANVAQFTDYTIVPRGATLTSITGPASEGFDIWEDATACQGANCVLTHDGDTYTVPNGQSGALLSASTFTTAESNIDCAGYNEITGDVIWHEYTGDGPVLVTIHITRAEMKSSANNGQARVEVCVGLVDDPGGLTGQQKWQAVGVTNAVLQDTDGVGGGDTWVALAPTCPNQSPSSSAPCVAQQSGDGNGGSFTNVWIPGGDPPRRT